RAAAAASGAGADAAGRAGVHLHRAAGGGEPLLAGRCGGPESELQPWRRGRAAGRGAKPLPRRHRGALQELGGAGVLQPDPALPPPARVADDPDGPPRGRTLIRPSRSRRAASPSRTISPAWTWSSSRSRSLGAFYRRLAARIGKAKAVTATARKRAVLFYNALRFGMAYADPGASYYEERYKQRVIRNLHRRAKDLGFTLVEANVVGVS